MGYTVLLPAAGSGTRMQAKQNKLFLLLANKPIIIRTLEIFQKDPACDGMIIAVKEEEQPQFEALIKQYQLTKPIQFVRGGIERQQSVAACLSAHTQKGIVLVHDAARPFLRIKVLQALVKAAEKEGAAIAGVKAKDTMKLTENGFVVETVNREQLWSIQTPQAFRYEILQRASQQAEEEGFLGTDESMIVERMGHPIRIIESSYDNVKMTTQEDLVFGEIILKRQKEEANE